MNGTVLKFQGYMPYPPLDKVDDWGYTVEQQARHCYRLSWSYPYWCWYWCYLHLLGSLTGHERTPLPEQDSTCSALAMHSHAHETYYIDFLI